MSCFIFVLICSLVLWAIYEVVKKSFTDDKQRKKVLIFAAPFIIAVFIVVPVYFLKTESYYRCVKSKKIIGKALDKYGESNSNIYPTDLNLLVEEGYVPNFPQGIHTGYDNERGSYLVSDDRKSFTLYCSWETHEWTGIPKGFPQYSSQKGLQAPFPFVNTGLILKKFAEEKKSHKR